MKPGAKPANRTFAAAPPIETSGLAEVSESGFAIAASPLAGASVTRPRPLANISRNSPFRTGRELGETPAGAASEPVPEISIAPCPAPVDPVVKSPGLNPETGTCTGSLICGPMRTVKLAWRPLGKSQGICTLSWPGEAKNNGERSPFQKTVVPPSMFGRGWPGIDSASSASAVPNTEAIIPGATVVPLVKLAEFTTPDELTAGTAAGAGRTANSNTGAVPPSRRGLTTLTTPVPSVARSRAKIVTRRCWLSMKAVGRGFEFH